MAFFAVSSRSDLQRQGGLALISAQELMSGSRTMGTAIERRRAVRYQLRAPVTFKSVEDQIAKLGAGFVKNISTESVFVLCPRLLPVGDLIELEILLPPFGTSDANLVFRSTGLVVRVEDGGGFAVAAKFSLHRYHGHANADSLKRNPNEVLW